MGGGLVRERAPRAPRCKYETAIRPILKTKYSGAANPGTVSVLHSSIVKANVVFFRSLALSLSLFFPALKLAKTSINLWSQGILLVLDKVLLK